MDALELLTQDHQKVKEPKKKQQLFDQIETELEIHTHIEETVFYPAMEQHAELKDMVAEAREEHEEVKTLLEELEDLAPDDEEFENKLHLMIENVEHHAEEEEEEMFPKVREICDERSLSQLGKQLEAAKGKQQRAAS
jgi:hemerythrin superfamily protein